MTRYLIATVDGAGNLVPTLGLAARLAALGHDVRLLGHPSIHERCGAHGWRPVEYATVPPMDSAAPRDMAAEMAIFAEEIFFNAAIGADVLAELDREPADVLVADCLAWGACAAGEVAGVPTAALFHLPISILRGGPLVEAMTPALPMLHHMRATLGAPPVAGLAEAHDALALGLVAVPAEFDVAVPLPPTYRYVGPILDGPGLGSVEPVPALDADRPLVLVSYSTSFQGQLGALQQTIDELAGLDVQVLVTTGPSVDPADLKAADNTILARFVAHGEVLPKAAAVVAHCGLGTAMNSLAHGVPMVCVPQGRDQMFNAAMVARLGAGLAADLDVPGTVARAVQQVLDDPAPRSAAGAFAQVIASCGGADAAVEALERIARP
ncbi:MAG: glycosyltransferase [Sporichthyaceae bacterium]